MPIYRASFPGVEGTILVRADSAAQAKDQVVAMKALTSDELADALDAGEKVYKPGEPIIPPTDEQKLQAKADEGASMPPASPDVQAKPDESPVVKDKAPPKE